MLRLVHPAREGQGTGTPKGLRFAPCLPLSADGRRHLRAALHNLRRAYGTWACLADAMGVALPTLAHATRERNPQGSPALALRAARAGSMSVEAVLGGKLTAAGQCEACGSRIGHGNGAARAAGGAS